MASAAPQMATEGILRIRSAPEKPKDVTVTAGRGLWSRRMAEGGEDVQLGTGVVDIGKAGCATQLLGLRAHPDAATKRLALPPLQNSL